jgi:hypothetical protein
MKGTSDPGPSTVVNQPHAATRLASTVARMLVLIGRDCQRSAIREFEASDVDR